MDRDLWSHPVRPSFSFPRVSILTGIRRIAGDIISAVLSYFFVLRKCREAELPTALESRMVFSTSLPPHSLPNTDGRTVG